MQDYFFTTQKITVGYHGIPLIRDIEIGLDKGEILTLIGPNGAGKSTILKSITGQLSLLAGRVVAGGFCLSAMSEKERAKKMSVMLTDRVRPELMTCAEIVSMGRYPYTGTLGILSGEDWDKVREAMKLVGISELSDRNFMTLSDGQKQRVMLARAIAQEPEILVLDEPTSFLDLRGKLEFLSVLRELAGGKNLTVILSLHEPDLAELISDKILCVKEGHIDRFGTAEEVLNLEYISGLYEISQEKLKALGSWKGRK